MTNEMRHWTTTAPNPLGRIHLPDERDDQFLMTTAAQDDEGEEALGRGWRYWWQDGWWGDQWYTPQCVAYAWGHLLEDGPTTQAPRAPQREAVINAQGQAIISPAQLYAEAQTIDEWPGTDYDGTSVRAGAKILVRQGLLAAYEWAWDVDTVVEAILTRGPVVVGTTWYEEMSTPDSQGVIHAEGDSVGGHAYVLNGVNRETEVVRIKNSWGRGWADEGNALLRLEDLDALLRDYGEACLPIEVE